MGFVGLSLLAGSVGVRIGVGAFRAWYHSVALPPFTVDEQAFGPIWAALYLMIGVAAWLVWRHGRRGPIERMMAARGLRLWGWQLLANAAWIPALLGLHSPTLGLLVILAVGALSLATTLTFRRVRMAAAALMLPYLLWTCYTAYVNAGVLWLNARM